MFHLIYDQNHHCEFHQIYVRTVETVYIKHFVTRFTRYIRYCKQCQKKQTTKHVSYEQLISIKIMILCFHIVIVDFIVAVSFFESKMNVVLIITDKYFKRVSMLSKMTIWSASQWTTSWFDSFQKKEWRVFRTILFDRNKKFVAIFWKITFSYLKIALLFIIAYHFQKND